MELEALKASWNKLDERLAETEIVNLRMVKEMIQQKTKSAFDHIMGQNIYSFVVNMLIICVVFPFVYLNTPIQTTSFAIVEGVMVIGLIPLVWKLSLLSKFDLGGKSSSELSRLVLTYKKVCHQEKVWMIGAVCRDCCCLSDSHCSPLVLVLSLPNGSFVATPSNCRR